MVFAESLIRDLRKGQYPITFRVSRLTEFIFVRSLDIEECAAYLKVDRSTVLKLAMQGVLPGAKIGRAWVFPEAELAAFLSSEVKRQQTERQELQAQPLHALDARQSRSTPDDIPKRKRGQRLSSYLQTLPETCGKI